MSWTTADIYSSQQSQENKASMSALHVKPQFVNNSTAEVFAPRGGTASIECHVQNLGDRVVSSRHILNKI